MKKNAMLKIAAILMVAVLLTTCAISSTFAKYVTTGTDDAVDARVAKWGVNVTVTTDDAFYTKYNDTTEDIVIAGTEVVAPGTQKTNAITITVTGTPEVDATISAGESTFLTLDNWTIGATDYCPLVFNIGTENYYVGKTADITDSASLARAVNNAIGTALGSKIEAGETANVSITLGWSWYYESDDVPSSLTGFTLQDDDKDSDLGDIAATDTDNAPTVSFNASITVTQDGDSFATNGAYVAPSTPGDEEQG